MYLDKINLYEEPSVLLRLYNHANSLDYFKAYKEATGLDNRQALEMLSKSYNTTSYTSKKNIRKLGFHIEEVLGIIIDPEGPSFNKLFTLKGAIIYYK